MALGLSFAFSNNKCIMKLGTPQKNLNKTTIRSFTNIIINRRKLVKVCEQFFTLRCEDQDQETFSVIKKQKYLKPQFLKIYIIMQRSIGKPFALKGERFIEIQVCILRNKWVVCKWQGYGQTAYA